MKILRRTLLDALTATKAGVAKKSAIEQASHFIFTGEHVVTYNDKMSVLYPFETDFKCSAPAEQLLRVLEKIKSEEVELTHKDEKLHIKAAKTRAQLATSIDKEIFGYIEQLDVESAQDGWKKLPKNFVEGLRMCAFSVSTDMTILPLTCIYVNKNTVTSSDRFRISVFKLEKAIKDSFLLPGTSAFEVINFPVVKYFVSESWIFFGTKDGLIFCSRIIDADFPVQEDHFDFKGKKAQFPAELKEIASNVSIFSEGQFDNDKHVTIKVKDGVIKCKGKSDVGWMEQSAKMKYKGKPLSFAVNPWWLAEVLDKSAKTTVGEDRLLFETDSFKHLVCMHTGADED